MAKRQALDAKTRFEANEQAAESIVEMEQHQEKASRLEREKREDLIAQTYRMIGRIETADLFGKLATVASLVWLKQVKESRIYLEIPDIGSWESFCNRLGKSRRLIDEQLQNLSTFGEEFLATCRQFEVSYKDLRKLRKAASDGDLIIDGNFVLIGDEQIPMTPENSEDLEAAVEALLESRDRKIKDQNLRLKAKDRVLEEKERVIQRQEKDLEKLKREAKARGFEPGEENFIKDMENQKVIITGLALKLDWRNMPEEMTPLMASTYVETLGHAVRTFRAYYDTATDIYGIGDIDDDWVPPHERDGEEIPEDRSPESEEVGCIQCRHHRGMSNSKKGVRIPGEFGKCIRPGGLCDAKSSS